MGKAVKNIKLKDNQIIFFLCSFAAFIRAPFLSFWLEDWDSVQFALGIGEFSIIKHQPHPPGYPLYIVLARILNFFVQNEVLSLTFLSFFLGILAIVPLYLLSVRMFGRVSAVVSVILYIFIPVSFVLSEIGISNIPGLFFYLLFIYFLYIDKEKKQYWPWLGFFGGLVLGVRFTEFLIIISLLVFVVVTKGKVREWLSTGAMFAFGVGVWFVPIILTTGLSNYKIANASTVEYLVRQGRLGSGVFIENILVERLSSFFELFLKGFTPGLALILLVVVFLTFMNRRLWKEERFRFIFVWFGAYFFPFLYLHLRFYYDLHLVQYVLPTLIPLIMLFSYWMGVVAKRGGVIRSIAFVGLGVLIVNLASVSLKEVALRAWNTPPTIAPVLYVRGSLPVDDTTIVSSFIYRQFQYYAPEFQNYYGVENIKGKIDSKYIVIDSPTLINEMPFLAKYKLIKTKKFEEGNLYFSRLKETEIFIFERV